MKTNLLIFVLLIAAGLTGCGADSNSPPLSTTPPAGDAGNGQAPGNDGGNTGDDGSVENGVPGNPPDSDDDAEPPADEPVETLALRLDELTERGVAPNGAITLVVDRALDPASVTEGIQLRDATTTQTVAADVAYEKDAKRIVVTPHRLLEEGKPYSVYVGKLRDSDGRMLVGTPVNARVKQRVYSKLTSYGEDGSIHNVIEYKRIPGKNEALRVRYTGTDEIRGYDHVTYLPGNVRIIAEYDGPGPDGAWFDGNDSLQYMIREHRRPDGRVQELLKSSAPGSDGDDFTEDDSYTRVQFVRYDEAGRWTLSVSASADPGNTWLNPGADGDWLTGDDPFDHYYRYAYDDEGHLSHELHLTDRGDDENWFTDDDVIAQVTRYEYDSRGKLAVETLYTSPGEGGKWFDGNDYVYRIYRHQYEENVKLRETRDSSEYLSRYDYHAGDPHGRPLAEATFRWRGPDGMWHTEGDMPGSLGAFLYRYTYDANGALQQWIFLIDDNGEDGLRFTGDEIAQTVWVRGYDDSAQVSYWQSLVTEEEIAVDDWTEETGRLLYEYEYYDSEVIE